MTEIRASRITNLYNRMISILGNGSGQNGYGQGSGAGYGPELSSYPVSNNPGSNMPNTVSAADINALFADMLRCRIHQVGTAPIEIAEIVQDLNVVGLNSSFFIDNQGEVTVDPDGARKGITDYEALMTRIEADKFLVHPNQVSIEAPPSPFLSPTRTTPWNGIIAHEFTVSFRNSDHRRHFFNSGGEIRFSSSNSNIPSGPGFAKSQDWNNMLVGIGTVKFNYQTTVSTTNAGTASNIGNYQLTNTYQDLYIKVRSSGLVVYSGNQYKIEGRQINASQIQFRVSYADIAEDGNIDENVTGTLASNISIQRANSNLGVKVPPPSFNNNVSLQ